MANNSPKIGFSYFASPEYYLDRPLNTWLSALHRWGCSLLILAGDFDLAIPEDVFMRAQEHGLDPVVHFKTVLPTARSLNDAALLLDVYKKWGVSYVILGDQPNIKQEWSIAKWHYETLVDNYLDRFIPLANHAVRIGLNVVMAPMQPGGDFWDCAFLELILSGLKRRKVDEILKSLVLSSYGYTYNKPLTWGEGGPERWPGSKPYYTPAGQEDQMGFNNFEWVQAASQRILGDRLPVIILDAGSPGPVLDTSGSESLEETVMQIVEGCRNSVQNGLNFDELVYACTFNLETLQALMGEGFSIENLAPVFRSGNLIDDKSVLIEQGQKHLSHYLLLPSYSSGVSDVVLNKVRPLIKKFQPTVGFSLDEAACASKVTIYPDPILFKDEHINALRRAGCKVEILPESGIEIATYLQG
jgi:hypothetical protein